MTVLKLVRVNFSVFPCYYGPVNQGEGVDAPIVSCEGTVSWRKKTTQNFEDGFRVEPCTAKISILKFYKFFSFDSIFCKFFGFSAQCDSIFCFFLSSEHVSCHF